MKIISGGQTGVDRAALDAALKHGIECGGWVPAGRLDEFFYILDGRFLIDLEDRTIDLRSRQGFVVPRGVIHRTRAPERAVILMVEGADINPTGD